MKKYTWLLIIPFIGFLFLALWGFTRLAIWPDWNFSNTGQIGDTIGGITAPFINLLGAILVYLSFRQQTLANEIQVEANEEQKKELKNDRDKSDALNKFNQLVNLIEDTDRIIKKFTIKTGSYNKQSHTSIDAFRIIGNHLASRQPTGSGNTDLVDERSTVSAYINLLKMCAFIVNGIDSYTYNDDLSKDILQVKYINMFQTIEEHLEYMIEYSKGLTYPPYETIHNYSKELVYEAKFIKMTTNHYFV